MYDCMEVVEVLVFFFKQKTAYEMRISDWSSDVCSSDLGPKNLRISGRHRAEGDPHRDRRDARRIFPANQRRDARQEPAHRGTLSRGSHRLWRNEGPDLDRKSVV